MSCRPSEPDRPAERGFALIEVLVAVAVAAVIMGVLIRSFSATWGGIVAVREEAEAMLLARSLLQHDPAQRRLVPGIKVGSIGRYAWTVTTAKAPVIAPVKNADDSGEQPARPWMLYRVTVVMSAPSGRRTTLETFQLAQTPQSPQ
jgi:prepilin-type N-terminal cleavage/methylation domain-containing protein